MRDSNFRFLLSAVVLYSLLTVFTVNAAPVRFNQVVEVVNAKPGKANNGGFSELRLSNEIISFKNNDTGSDAKPQPTPPQDDRVIVETRVDVVEEDVCDCVVPPTPRGGFPYWALLPLAAVPFFFIPWDDDDDTPTRTPTTTPATETPTPGTQTPTPGTQTPTPGTQTPTPPTEPIPEPMTILLFGTGLAGIGLAARRKFGRRKDEEMEEEIE